MIALLALAGQLCWGGALSASSDTYFDSLVLLDRLAWASTHREVERFARAATGPAGFYAKSLREPHTGHAQVLDAPTLYAVEARLDDRYAWMYVRQAAVYTNRGPAPLRELVFRVFANGQDVFAGNAAMQGVWVDGQRAQWELVDTVLRVAMPRRLAPGEQVRVLLELGHGVPPFDPEEADGIERITSEQTGALGRYEESFNLGFWLPLLTPLDERGRWDTRRIPINGEHAWFEPAMFHVLLDLPANLTVATTGTELSRTEREGRASIVSVASGAREFAVHFSDRLDLVEQKVGGTAIRVFHPSDVPDTGAHLLQYATASYRYFSEAFGEIPLAEIDVVEAPVRVALGNEYPGLVTVDLTHKGVQYNKSAEHEWTVAHEIAHQWWYSEVGNDAAGSPWLDEALSSYAAAMYWEDRYGRDAVEALFDSEIREPYALMRESGAADLPANLAGDRYDLNQYASIVYGRAVLFFDELRSAIGDAPFKAALRRYLRQNHCRFADEDGLLDAFRSAASDPAVVDRLFQRWIAEAHGYEDVVGVHGGR